MIETTLFYFNVNETSELVGLCKTTLDFISCHLDNSKLKSI
jgi:hypothetical protein